MKFFNLKRYFSDKQKTYDEVKVHHKTVRDAFILTVEKQIDELKELLSKQPELSLETIEIDVHSLHTIVKERISIIEEAVKAHNEDAIDIIMDAIEVALPDLNQREAFFNFPYKAKSSPKYEFYYLDSNLASICLHLPRAFTRVVESGARLNEKMYQYYLPQMQQYDGTHRVVSKNFIFCPETKRNFDMYPLLLQKIHLDETLAHPFIKKSKRKI